MKLPKGLKKAFIAVAPIAAGAAIVMGPGAGTASAEGFCATDNGIQHCESFRFERHAGLGRIIWEKVATAHGPGVNRYESARYWGPIPPDAMNFLPRFNGHGVDKAVDAPWCVDHT